MGGLIISTFATLTVLPLIYFTPVDVKKRATEGELVEVVGPLAPGDRVVRRATDELRDGAALDRR